MRWIAWCVSALTLHTAVNAQLLRTPVSRPLDTRTSVLLPVRDEAHRVEACLRALLAQEDNGRMEVVVLDDGSSDGTFEVVAEIVAGDPRVVVLRGQPLPEGWLGKPHACQQLADAADPASDVLIFVDADVVLAPGAVAATVATLHDTGLDVVSPYPRQEAPGMTRLVQPLLQWSWLTFLPLRVAEQSARPSVSAANGQLLAVRRSVYDRIGGHAAVRDQVVEDLALLRAVKRAGGRGGIVDGTQLATTRMYDGWRELADGYGKSLHTVPPAVPVLLALLYVAPVFGRSRAARIACAAGVLGRVISARRTGGRVLDSITHPVGVAALVGLDLHARLSHRRGTQTWKGRAL
jgi:cellulose synthase/poly-beta-1,6-N-acetylglucosamine synthase-like glycosyltransferase